MKILPTDKKVDSNPETGATSIQQISPEGKSRINKTCQISSPYLFISMNLLIAYSMASLVKQNLRSH
tara:strand:+ start:161 stop:361 length:201 start_codon:yes stop_codon:yes gene_type:complete